MKLVHATAISHHIGPYYNNQTLHWSILQQLTTTLVHTIAISYYTGPYCGQLVLEVFPSITLSPYISLDQDTLSYNRSTQGHLTLTMIHI